MRSTVFPVAMLMVLALAGCSGSDGAAQPPEDDHHHHHGDGTDATGSGEFEVAIGAAVSLAGDYDAIAYEVTYTVTAVEPADVDDAGDAPAENDTFVVVDVEVHGFRGEHEVGPDNPDYIFSLIDDDGTEYGLSTQIIAPGLSGTVSADETVTGKLVFDAAARALEGGKIRLQAVANGSDLTIDWPY